MSFYTNVFQRGNKVYYRGYDNDNRRVAEAVEYKPYLFIPHRRDTNTRYRTLNGRPVERIDFDSIRDAKDFIEKYKEVDNFEIYGLTNFQYLYIYDRFHGEIEFDPTQINVVSIDIETDSSDGFPDIEKADKEIVAISLSRKNEKVVFGMKDFVTKDENIHYIKCKDEWHLLQNFLKVWQSGRYMPDILTGWNIEFFDMPYLVNRIKGILGDHEAKKLSPWGILDERTIEIRGRENKTYVPAGITILDYLHLYRKFSFKNQESYKLDHIAEEELGERKVDYHAEGYTSLDDLYQRNYQRFIEYNIHDVVLVDRLEERLGFIQMVITFAYDAKVNFADTLTTVRPWDVIIHNYLLDRAIVIPQMKRGSGYDNLVGGYVKEPKLGMSKWVVSFDLNSLYPHLIMQYNISPEMIVRREEMWPRLESIIDGYAVMVDGYANAANGVLFSKQKQGFLPGLMEKMYNDRVAYKQNMLESKKVLAGLTKDDDPELKRNLGNLIAKYHNLQLAKKIQLNSAYGALGNEYFRWFNFDMAEAITMSGQLAIRWIERKFNEYLNKLLKTDKVDYIIASDTDSIYVNLEPLAKILGVDDMQTKITAIDTFCEKKLQPMINRAYEELAEYTQSYQQKMIMKRETIADKGIWKAKKMYILNAWDVEGVRYKEPQLKLQGIEAVRSSTPKACRSSIKQALKIIMNEDEATVQAYIADFKSKFMQLPFEEVAFPRGVKGLEKYSDRHTIYSKGTPIHVKGALLFNHMIKKKGLDKKYQEIGDGDKIKFALLKAPNPLHDTVISVLDELPIEFGLQQYIDYDAQFQKSFLEPIKSIMDTIGWDTEKRATLMSFFD
jgi:DNA polymerase elongation subunit (family B)